MLSSKHEVGSTMRSFGAREVGSVPGGNVSFQWKSSMSAIGCPSRVMRTTFAGGFGTVSVRMTGSGGGAGVDLHPASAIAPIKKRRAKRGDDFSFAAR